MSTQPDPVAKAVAAMAAAATPPIQTAAPAAPPKILAKPLSDPDFFGVRPKDANIAFYWSDKAYDNGYRLDYNLARGFEFALPEDCKPETLPKSLQRDGKIIYGTLVLLKMPKEKYYGALLNNHNKAVRRLTKRGISERGEAMVQEEIAVVPARRSDRAKIMVYAPASPHEIQEAIREGRL